MDTIIISEETFRFLKFPLSAIGAYFSFKWGNKIIEKFKNKRKISNEL